MSFLSRAQINTDITNYTMDPLDICLRTQATEAMHLIQSGGCYTCKEGVARLRAMTVADLRKIAASLDIKGRSALKTKEDLVKAIKTKAKKDAAVAKKKKK